MTGRARILAAATFALAVALGAWIGSRAGAPGSPHVDHRLPTAALGR